MQDFLQAIGMAETNMPATTMLIRLVIACVFGAIIGFEREMNQHTAGLRTHIVIALAAALYTIIVLEITHLPEVVRQGQSDPTRAVEAVTAGIAFLGAGAIFRRTGGPRGLTTGAGMWLAGATGMAAALGYYVVGLFVCIVAVLVLRLLKLFVHETPNLEGEPESPENPAPEKDRT